jgi:chemotaxis response regulator CheB
MGLNALAVIMEECPLPVVMLSSLTQEGTDATVRALSLGAVDFISKAGGSISRIDTIESEILQKCRNAAQAHVHKTLSMPDPVKAQAGSAGYAGHEACGTDKTAGSEAGRYNNPTTGITAGNWRDRQSSQ